MEIRLQKYLADCGVASRRKAEKHILAGDVSVNGQVVCQLGTKVTPEKDIVLFKGKAVEQAKRLYYIMLHKPEGYVTTVKDQFERKTVMDLVQQADARLFPVGRLDYDTSGLLILTNDGDLAYRLTHPKHMVEKTYVAKLFGTPTNKDLQTFAGGMSIEGQMTKPAAIKVIRKDEKYCTVQITISEGRNRQIRKMCDQINHPVATLKRVGVGKLFLGDLKKGQHRKLTKQEVSYLKSI